MAEILKHKVDAYPKAIQSYVEKVAEVKSRPAIAKLEKALADAKNYQIGNAKNKYQQAVVYYDGCVSNAIDAAQNISTVAGRKEADDAIKGIRDMTLDAKRRQFDSYQKWAIDRCKDAFDKLNSFTTWTSDHAWQGFNAGNLARIDQTLLSPDVSRMFNDINVENYRGCKRAHVGIRWAKRILNATAVCGSQKTETGGFLMKIIGVFICATTFFGCDVLDKISNRSKLPLRPPRWQRGRLSNGNGTS